MTTRPPLRTTHTVVLLEVSRAAYDEIAAKLREHEYDHVFDDHLTDDGRESADMTGIALYAAAGEDPLPADVVELQTRLAVTQKALDDFQSALAESAIERLRLENEIARLKAQWNP